MPPVTETEGSASEALANRLAKFAYDDTKSPSRSSPRSTRLPSGPPSPITPIRNSHVTASTSASGKRGRGSSTRHLAVDDVKKESPESLAGPSRTLMTAKAGNSDGDEPEDSTLVKKKAKKVPRPYAGPEVYAHLKNTPDHLAMGLDIVFCGINPGQMSAATGTHFAHPTNKFWRALHMSGLTPRLYAPSEGHLLPQNLNYGMTNLCGRPTAEQSELSTLEMRLKVHPFTLKLLQYRPRVVCFVGKKIWDVYEATAGKTAIVVARPVPQIVKTELGDEVESESAGLHRAGKRARTSSPLTDLELDIKPTLVPSTPLRSKPATPQPASSSKRKSATKVPFDWYAPRSLRLPLPPEEDGSDGGYCYFWVTPSTSGLERTPLAEQANIFAALRSFSESLKAKEGVPDQAYRDINLAGLAKTSEKIKTTAKS